MLRVTVGLGYSSAESQQGTPNKLAFSGVSDSFSFDIGGALDENWTLHARFALFSMFDPSFSVDGADLVVTDDSMDTSYLFGPALTYNIMPANVYLTVALGLSWLTRKTDQYMEGSDIGLGANLDLGKEWWVSNDWGVGISGRFWFSSVNDSGGLVEATYTMFGVAALFSATYN